MLTAALLAVSSTAFAALPSHTTKVVVTAGNTHSGIDAAMTVAASISGKVTAAKGGAPLANAAVWVYSGQTVVNSRSTDFSGNYTIPGLAAGSYTVCASPSFFASGGSSKTGYLGRCYQTATWVQGAKVPTSAKHVSVSLGQTKTGINVSLPTAAAMSGKVTTKSGKAITGVTVTLRNRNTGTIVSTGTTTNGTFAITGLEAPSKGYTVCFNPQFAPIKSGTGYLPRCFHNAAWNGLTTKFPTSAKAVKTTLGKTHTGVKQVLNPAGAVSGTVTDAKSKKGLANVSVIAYSPQRTFVQFALTNSKGQYTMRGLAPATKDHVCAFPAVDSTTHLLHTGRCWKTVAFNGTTVPKSANNVSVKVGKTHRGVNLKLGRQALGSISGNITESAGHQPLDGATVTAYASNGLFGGSAATDSQGNYTIQNLRALPSPGGYRVCVSPPSFSSSPPMPTDGWAPRCYTNVAWNGNSPVPSAATKLSLKAGQKRKGVNVALGLAGAISGTVTQAGGGSNPVSGVSVFVYTPQRGTVGFFTLSASDGTYTVSNIPPGSYIVCFDGRSDTFNGVPQGFRPQCYKNKVWDGSA